MGQKATLARYPLHWHLSQASRRPYLRTRNSSIWKTNSRCVTIHGTDGLRIEDNVCYDHLGHGYFMEDGAESGNHLERNLGLVPTPTTADRLLPSDDAGHLLGHQSRQQPDRQFRPVPRASDSGMPCRRNRPACR